MGMNAGERVVRRFLAGEVEVTLAKLRKGKGSAPVSLNALLPVLEHLGFELTPLAKWVKSPFHERAPLELAPLIESRAVPRLPSPQPGETVYLNVKVGPHEVTFEQYEGETGYIIRSPSGAETEFLASSISALKPTPDLWKWLKKQPAYAPAMTPVVVPTFTAPRTGPSAPRTLDNTGTCACCFRNVKLQAGEIVMHGFTRPGQGSGLQGKCFGVGFPPFEVSAKGTKAYLDVVLKEIKRFEDQIEKVKAGDVAELPDPIHYGRKLPKDGTAPEVWARAIDSAVPLLQHRKKGIEAEAEKLSAIIRGWKSA